MKPDVPAEAARACPPVARPRGVRGERAGGGSASAWPVWWAAVMRG
jgi:hypothetical protein